MPGHGDASFLNRKLGEGNSSNNAPRSRSFVKGVGGILMAGAIGIGALGYCVIQSLDFFGGLKRRDFGPRDDRRGDNRPDRRPGRR